MLQEGSIILGNDTLASWFKFPVRDQRTGQIWDTCRVWMSPKCSVIQGTPNQTDLLQHSVGYACCFYVIWSTLVFSLYLTPKASTILQLISIVWVKENHAPKNVGEDDGPARTCLPENDAFLQLPSPRVYSSSFSQWNKPLLHHHIYKGFIYFNLLCIIYLNMFLLLSDIFFSLWKSFGCLGLGWVTAMFSPLKSMQPFFST